jgi:hypothetical protein
VPPFAVILDTHGRITYSRVTNSLTLFQLVPPSYSKRFIKEWRREKERKREREQTKGKEKMTSLAKK